MNRIFARDWTDYELIDAGGGRKLERFGSAVVIRPDVNAYFSPDLTSSEWKNMAMAEFVQSSATSGSWTKLKPKLPDNWTIGFRQLTINLRFTKFKHLGIFPEQNLNWEFIAHRLSPGKSFLNLFAYTGIASLVARSAGAQVCHCDSVRQINVWAQENMSSSSLNDIRWICDDALKFGRREVKRGVKYDGIMMDPPAYGLGANKERWKLDDKIAELIEIGSLLLNPEGFLIVNTYSPRVESETLRAICSQHFKPGQITAGRLAMKSGSGKILDFGDLCQADLKK